MKVEWVCGNTISYNVSGSMQWVGGRLKCTRDKFKKMVREGNYSANGKDHRNHEIPNI